MPDLFPVSSAVLKKGSDPVSVLHGETIQLQFGGEIIATFLLSHTRLHLHTCISHLLLSPTDDYILPACSTLQAAMETINTESGTHPVVWSPDLFVCMCVRREKDSW